MVFENVSRWNAFAVHLVISFVIFLGLLGLICFVWYPSVFITMGGWQGIKIIAGVDLVLGPVLTLIVFNPRKKSLKWDLAAIGMIQLSCLIAGTWLVYSQRPVAQILSFDGVYIMTPEDYKNVIPNELSRLPGSYPKLVFLKLPSDLAELSLLRTMQAITGEDSFEQRVEFYRPLNETYSEDLLQRVKTYGFNKDDNCYWMPIYSSWVSGNVCFSLSKGLVKVNEGGLL